MSLKPDNYIKDRKNVTIFLEKKIKMKLSKIVSCISCVRGHQNKKQSAIHKLLPYKDNRDFIYRIKKCEKTRLLDLRNLNLNNSDVEEILKYVTKKNITVQMLDLRFNKLTTLPDSIVQLQGLEWLDLGDNHLTTLPDSIGKLQSLKHLHLSYNHLRTLPDSIGQLQRLKVLYLGHNLLITLPESIGKLQSLIHLDLRFNELTALPESIGDLQSLEDLYLTKNYLNVESIQFQNGITGLFRDQKNENNFKCDFQNAQQAKQIIHDKVLYYTENPLGQLTLEETFNHAVFNSLDQSKVPINIDNKFIYSLIGLLKLEEKYQDELPSIKRQIDHLQKIASERNWEIPDAGETALHWAAYYGSEDIVQALVRAGADVNVTDDDGWTAGPR